MLRVRPGFSNTFASPPVTTLTTLTLILIEFLFHSGIDFFPADTQKKYSYF